MWKHELLKAKRWTGQSFNFAHAKLDGHCLSCFKQPSGLISLQTTTGVDILDSLRDYPWVGPLFRNVPSHTSIIGELWVPGEPASFVKTAIKEQDKHLVFTAFAVPVVEGHKIYEAAVSYAGDLCRRWGVDFAYWTPAWPDDALLELAKERGYEGWVLKEANYQGWWKLKVLADPIDLVVIDFKDGKGKNIGLVGSLRCATTEGYEVASVSGMDDKTRIEIDEDKDVGRVCEVAYQYVGSKGRLRHCQFVRWRDDKTAKQCPASQDPALERYWIGAPP